MFGVVVGDMYIVVIGRMVWYVVGYCMGILLVWVNKLYLCGLVILCLVDLFEELEVDFCLFFDLCDLDWLKKGFWFVVNVLCDLCLNCMWGIVFFISYLECVKKVFVLGWWNVI